MATLYKLTTQDFKTRKGKTNETLWGEGVTHSGTGEGGMRGPGYIHAYTDPLLAVLLNPIHVRICDPVLWECEGDVAKTDHGLKVGCVTLTTLRRIDLPAVTTEQVVKFAVHCVLEIRPSPAFAKWAAGWLDGSDRSESAARAVAWASAWAAKTEEAAKAAETAADAAVWAAKTEEVAWAAKAALVAARTAAWAAEWAAQVVEIDLIALARKAIA